MNKLRSKRFRRKSFFRIAYSDRTQNKRSERKHIGENEHVWNWGGHFSSRSNLHVARMRIDNKPMPSARIAMNAACAATGSSAASSFVRHHVQKQAWSFWPSELSEGYRGIFVLQYLPHSFRPFLLKNRWQSRTPRLKELKSRLVKNNLIL